jgi:TRAP-type C4-dicarboxylate transport system permease large subunit
VLADLTGGDYVTAADAAYGMTSDELKIWFGILALVVVELGLITPPVGLNVFIIGALSGGTPMGEIFRGVMPFFAAEILRIGILLAVPALALALPAIL